MSSTKLESLVLALALNVESLVLALALNVQSLVLPLALGLESLLTSLLLILVLFERHRMRLETAIVWDNTGK